MVVGIARAALAVHAFVKLTIPFGALPVALDAGSALLNDRVTDGRRPGLIATRGIDQITGSASAGHTLVP